MPNQSSADVRISLVIPAFNEAEYLPRILASLEEARAAYHRGPEAVEVIVADNASTDATADVARARGCRVTHVERRRIAAARNGGAALARGDILCFVDADTVSVHPRTFDAIDAAIESGTVVAGASGVRIERWSLGLVVTWVCFVPFLVLTRFDTGVVFCRRRDFEAVGGYDESRRFGEDVMLLWELRKLGGSRGQRLKRLKGVKAIASARKFDEFGDWHYFTQMIRLAPKILLRPGATDAFADRYWYDQRK